MKKYFIIVFRKALEVSYKSFFLGRDCPDTLYIYIYFSVFRKDVQTSNAVCKFLCSYRRVRSRGVIRRVFGRVTSGCLRVSAFTFIEQEMVTGKPFCHGPSSGQNRFCTLGEAIGWRFATNVST